MATTRSNTLGCGSLSIWMRILRLSTVVSHESNGPRGCVPRIRHGAAPHGLRARIGTDKTESELREERVSHRATLLNSFSVLSVGIRVEIRVRSPWGIASNAAP